MKKNVFLIIGLFIFTLLSIAFINKSSKEKWVFSQKITVDSFKEKTANIIQDIPLPKDFVRFKINENGFATWLRNVHLKPDNIVRYYNGRPIEHQDLHFAVLDISTGTKDLQQCADAVMRLKAEYYFSKKNFDSISFSSGNTFYNFKKYAVEHDDFSHEALLKFLESVFINCGTYTIDEMTKPVKINEMKIGDVFVKAGAPGHTMMVVDMAYNIATKKTIYLLAQGYMPAQDMHIVVNPLDDLLSPWYEINTDETVVTPGFIFTKNQLKSWK